MPPVGQAAQRAPGCQLPVEFVGGYDTGFRSRTAQTPPAGGAEIDVTRVPRHGTSRSISSAKRRVHNRSCRSSPPAGRPGRGWHCHSGTGHLGRACGRLAVKSTAKKLLARCAVCAVPAGVTVLSLKFPDGPLGAQAGGELRAAVAARSPSLGHFSDAPRHGQEAGTEFLPLPARPHRRRPGDALVSGSHSPTSERSPTLLLLGTLMISPQY